MRLGASPAVTESIPASILDGLTLEAVEWLPSGTDSGLVRVRGRAEAAEQAQARGASEALRALDALERRGSELEARVEALTAERDVLAAQARAFEQRAPRAEHQRRALSDALAAASAARRQTREW